VTAVFFSVGFCILIIHNRLLTAGSSIEIAGFARALVGGLIVAKVLLSVDLLPFVHAFPHKPLAHNIVWKTSLYVAASVIFLYAEPLIKGLFKGMGLAVSHGLAWNELMQPRTWATVIWLAVLLVAFVTMQEQSRVIGKDQLKRMFFGQRGEPPTETQFRDVA
jgi:hypothetical protein